MFNQLQIYIFRVYTKRIFLEFLFNKGSFPSSRIQTLQKQLSLRIRMGNVDCCKNQDCTKNNQLLIDETIKPTAYNALQLGYLQQKQQQTTDSNIHKNYIEFNKTQGIPQYLGINIQNLGELHNFAKFISHQVNKNRPKLNNEQMNQNLINNNSSFYLPQTEKQYINVIEQVKLGIFQLKRNAKKNIKALEIDKSLQLNKKISNQPTQTKTRGKNGYRFSDVNNFGYQNSQNSKNKTPSNRKSKTRQNFMFGYQAVNYQQPKILQQTPYFIPWLSLSTSIAIYIGQWRFQNKHLKKNLPCGIGRLYFGGKWIYQGFLETIVINSNQQDHMFLFQNQIKRIFQLECNFNNQSTAKKIQFLALNLTVVLNGQGRKFNKTQQYMGQFVQGQLHCSTGLYKNSQLEYSYQGKFVHGIKSGKGVQKTKLTYYQGNFQDNKKQGYGTLMFYISTRQQRQRQQQSKKISQKNQQTDPQFVQIKQRVEKQLELEKTSTKILKSLLKRQIQNYQGEQLFTFQSKINKSLLENLKLEQSLRTLFLEKYIGEFSNDKFNGKGSYQWANGNYYVGEWFQGKMDGVGQFYWKEGYSYIGQYKNDLKHGKGQMIWDPFRRYRGTWAFGRKHGYGQQIKIQLSNQQNLIIIIKSCLWKNNTAEKVFWTKQIKINQIQFQSSLLLMKHIEFYYPQNPGLSQQKKIQLQSLKYYSKPCEICQQFFLRRPEKKGKIKQNNEKQNQLLFNVVSAIKGQQKKNKQSKIKRNGLQVLQVQSNQPKICKQCQQKLKSNDKNQSK